MAVFGLGSHEQPIIVSDDEDAAHVENELNRWNSSVPSSASSSPAVRDYPPHALQRPVTQATTVYAPTFPTVTLSTKRKRQEVAHANGGVSLHAIADNSERRTKKKKQKARQDPSQVTKHARVASFQYEQYDHSERHWSSNRSGIDSAYPPGYPPFQHAAFLDTPLPVDTSSYQTTDMGRDYTDPLRVPHPTASYHQQAGPSWRLTDTPTVYPLPSLLRSQARLPPSHQAVSVPRASGSVAPASNIRRLRPEVQVKTVATNLDDSLRRLQALSDSLMAKSVGSPIPVRAHTPVALPPAAPPPADTDKRRIGKINDKTNAASFDLHSPTLLSPSTPTLSPPALSRTVVVAHLPKKFRHIDFVTTWAERFGGIVRLELDPKPGKALVEYESPAHAKAAFTSFKLRGDGKEHIRVYWYRGSEPSLSTATSRSGYADVEEGELEEGEVVEGASTSAPPKAKKKKGKKKPQPLEQRFTDAVPPYKPTQAISPRFGNAIASAPFLSPTRPSLEERFTDTPPLIEGVWEEEMELELDSEDDYRQQFSPTASPLLMTTLIATPLEEADVEDWEADMDVEASSPIREDATPLPLPISLPRHTSPSASRPRFLKRPRALSPSSLEEHRPSPASSTAEARRQELKSVVSSSKAWPATSSSSTAASTISSAESGTPEPVTPRDMFVDPAATVAFVTNSEPVVSPAMGTAKDAAPSSLAKVDKPAISLEDLAVSFITESIQAAIAPSSLRPQPSTSLLAPKSSAPNPHSPNNKPLLHIPLPRLPIASIPITPSVPSTPQLSGAAQLLAKKTRLEDHIAASKELLAKIAVAKTKAEKVMLMRLLKEKQRAMDVDLNGGRASPSTPGASVAPATPAPAQIATLFRWPQTPRELIIDVSDDEADLAR